MAPGFRPDGQHRANVGLNVTYTSGEFVSLVFAVADDSFRQGNFRRNTAQNMKLDRARWQTLNKLCNQCSAFSKGQVAGYNHTQRLTRNWRFRQLQKLPKIPPMGNNLKSVSSQLRVTAQNQPAHLR